jgi:hypothetical protein
LIDTRATDGYDPPLTGLFDHKPLAQGIFCRDRLVAGGIGTGGGESRVLVGAGHREIFLWCDMANLVPQRSGNVVAGRSRLFYLCEERSIFFSDMTMVREDRYTSGEPEAQWSQLR